MNRDVVKSLKAILVDVDGVLTDGSIYYDNQGNELKKFNVKDGQIVKYLKEQGFILGVITGRISKVVDRRVEELGFDFYRKGVSDKNRILDEFIRIYNIPPHRIAYMGDDIIDIPIFNRVGYSATPSDAREYIKTRVDVITPSKGGEGAFRDFADHILASMGLLDDILNSF